MLFGEVDLLKVGRRSLWAVEELNKRLGFGIVLMWRLIEEEFCLELKVKGWEDFKGGNGGLEEKLGLSFKGLCVRVDNMDGCLQRSWIGLGIFMIFI